MVYINISDFIGKTELPWSIREVPCAVRVLLAIVAAMFWELAAQPMFARHAHDMLSLDLRISGVSFQLFK